MLAQLISKHSSCYSLRLQCFPCHSNQTSSTSYLYFTVMLLLLFHLFTLAAPQAVSPSQISLEWQLLSFNITQADFDPKNGRLNPSVVELSFEMQEPDTKDLFLCERDFNALDPRSRNTSPIMLPLKSWQECASKSQKTVYFKVRNISRSELPVINLDIVQIIVRNDSFIKPSYAT